MLSDFMNLVPSLFTCRISTKSTRDEIILTILPFQAETINRLLKKQSTRQAKNKRLAIATTAPASHTHTAAATPAQANSDAEGEGGGGEEGEAEDEGDEKQREPEMYRWVSNAAGLSFSVPVGILPSTSEGDGLAVESATGKPVMPTPTPTLAAPPICDVRNCRQVRKYRLVSNWEKGACGMRHLKVLEGRVRS